MPVTVEPYNPAWPQQFEIIKSKLESYLKDVNYISIEHVGSTSVHDLPAKAIIDIDIIATRENLAAAISALEKAGLVYMGELGITDRHSIRLPDQDPPSNLYVCVDGCASLRNHLAIRDTLREDAELREEYGNVKLALAEQGVELHEYIERKSSIILKILKKSGKLTEAELAEIERASKQGERIAKIRTERLVLREFVLRDVDAMAELQGNEVVAKFQDWEPKTREESFKEVLDIARAAGESPRTHYELAVIHGDRFIGRVGAMVDRIEEPPTANLWFALLPEFHGKGYATEALKAFLQVLPRGLRMEIECDPRNRGSWRLAERLGAKKVRETEKAHVSKGEWVGSLVYELWNEV